MQQVNYQQNSYHYQDDSQYTSKKDFDQVVQTYLNNLSSKKRDKALVSQQQYRLILKVLQEPKNTSISTAQFRFWVKKMFQLVVPPPSRHNSNNGEPIVYHDQKPVAIKERIYDILLWAHRQSHHGGRDKTSALVRRKFSWIPKELVARFVRYCPYCVTRRNGHLNMFPTFSPIPTPPHIHPLDPTTTNTTVPFCSPSSPLPPSLSSSPSSSSTTFYHGVNSCCMPSPSIYNNMDDHHLHHQQYHQSDPLLASPENHPSSEDLLYPLPKLSISSTATSVSSDPSSSSSPHPSQHLNFYMDSSSHYYSPPQQPQQQQHYNDNNNSNTISITPIEDDSLGLNPSTRSSSISSTVSSTNYYTQQSQQQFIYSSPSHYPFLSNETKPIHPLNQSSSIYNNNNNNSNNSNNNLPIPASPLYPQHESKQILMDFVQQHHPSLNGMSFV